LHGEVLEGRVVLVTGVSRPSGIGIALARRMSALGAVVHASGWSAHDAEMPWGATDLGEVPFEVEECDLEDPEAPPALVDRVVDRHGALDVVLAVHARSSSSGLADLTADELDRCWAANVRSTVLLAQRFAEVHDPNRPGGRMVWFTSGQHHAPMPDELPYAVTKGALHQLTASLADALIHRGIVASCINPGPVDTGWATGDLHAEIAARFPSGRWTTPEEVADLVEHLVSDQGERLGGQVIDLEAGFRR
jgi:3-oxoacyl-[acyl-carrier protein] reductase